MRARLSLALLAVIAILAAGCGVPATTYCYTATSATVHAVDTGMQIAGDLYRQGKVSEATKAKMIAAHDIYRPAAKAAVDGCRVLSYTDQAGADKQVAAIQAAASHVIEALVAAGVK